MEWKTLTSLTDLQMSLSLLKSNPHHLDKAFVSSRISLVWRNFETLPKSYAKQMLTHFNLSSCTSVFWSLDLFSMAEEFWVRPCLQLFVKPFQRISFVRIVSFVCPSWTHLQFALFLCDSRTNSIWHPGMRGF